MVAYTYRKWSVWNGAPILRLYLSVLHQMQHIERTKTLSNVIQILSRAVASNLPSRTRSNMYDILFRFLFASIGTATRLFAKVRTNFSKIEILSNISILKSLSSWNPIKEDRYNNRYWFLLLLYLFAYVLVCTFSTYCQFHLMTWTVFGIQNIEWFQILLGSTPLSKILELFVFVQWTAAFVD